MSISTILSQFTSNNNNNNVFGQLFGSIQTNIINGLIEKFSINSINDVRELNDIIEQLKTNDKIYGLTDNWFDNERNELMTVWTYLENVGLTDTSVGYKVTEDMKSYCQKIESNVKKNLLSGDGLKTILQYLIG